MLEDILSLKNIYTFPFGNTGCLFFLLFTFFISSCTKKFQFNNANSITVTNWNLQTVFDGNNDGIEYSDFRKSKNLWNEDFYEELEELLISSDVGVSSSLEIVENLRLYARKNKIRTADEVREALKLIVAEMFVDAKNYKFEYPCVITIVGVNGVGKTTTIGKLAVQYKKAGKKVVLAAADTFRAAAIEQLTEWAHRAGVDISVGQEDSDPASVIYDAIAAAKARKADILLCDTAGRLHNKKNLMEELKKINRIIEREYPEAYRENLIVLDGTTGQNALVQAKQFKETADITGIVLTKLDGTAKGGIAIAIQAELGVPVKYIGIGEKIEDLQKFDTDAFVDALFTPAEEN